jgi:hypothetical protein
VLELRERRRSLSSLLPERRRRRLIGLGHDRWQPINSRTALDACNGVDEDKAGDKGEVSELDPGKAGALTVAREVRKVLFRRMFHDVAIVKAE